MHLRDKISEENYSDLPPELSSLCGCKGEFTVLCDTQALGIHEGSYMFT